MMQRNADHRISSGPEGFLKSESGVVLVEFAFALPLLLLIFAMMIESGRMMMSYQAAITGVRDATRYLARAVPESLCTDPNAATEVANLTGELQVLVAQGLSGKSLFAPNITIKSVTPSYSCFTGTYRNSPVAVAQVTADLNVTFPFKDIINWAGGGGLADFTTAVSDQARVTGS